MSLFRRLIDDRRSLSIYRTGAWLFYECPFVSKDLTAVARHIMRAHAAAPATEEDGEDGPPDLAA